MDSISSSPFFIKTEPAQIEKQSRNLSHLSSLFNQELGNISSSFVRAAPPQLLLNRLSEMKIRLADAIIHKQNYYQNNFFGKITKFFLKIFGMWNNGNTAAIQSAENALLATDTRNKLVKLSSGYETTRFFFPLSFTDTLRQNFDTSNFYNHHFDRRIQMSNGQFWNNGAVEVS